MHQIPLRYTLYVMPLFLWLGWLVVGIKQIYAGVDANFHIILYSSTKFRKLWNNYAGLADLDADFRTL